MRQMQIKHKVRISTYTWSMQQLIDLGAGLFKFNTRHDGDHENKYSYVYGEFIQDRKGKKNGQFYFKFDMPDGQTQLAVFNVIPDEDWYNVESVEIEAETR